MNETIFKFGVRFQSDDLAGQLQSVNNTLKAIPGVITVEGVLRGPAVELHVRAKFKDSVEAKKLHRRVMNSLMKTEKPLLTSASTVLTDIFN